MPKSRSTSGSGSEPPLVIRGWTIFAHPLFLDQIEALITMVERAKAKEPRAYARKRSAKLLAAIAALALDIIPADPGSDAFRLGEALGENRKHWFRAKFFQQFRLFFRYRAAEKIIIYAWVNDESTKRAHDSTSDAYRVFRKMLTAGNPPDDWGGLKAASRSASRRLKAALSRSVTGKS
jgi:toxin YhaV